MVDELNALIKEKTAAGWQFNFLGTGIDAYDTGSRMGVAAIATMASSRTRQHLRAAYASLGAATADFAAGRAESTHLSMSARAASGDEHYKRVFGSKAASRPTPPAPSPQRPTHKAVDDFEL